MSFIDWELENYPQNFGKLRCSEVIDRQTLTHVICNMDSPEGVERDVFARVMSEVAKTLDKVPFYEIEQQSGWISVKDRLPEMTGYYLVCTHNTFYDTYCISKVYFSGGVWGSLRKRYTNITHWMPLPEPPKEGTD